MLEFVLEISHYSLPVLGLAVLILCFVALIRRKRPPLGKTKLINTVNGDVFPLVSREASVGRHKNNDIILNYPTVSRTHAVIVCSKNGWYITEIRSDSEVLVNGNPIEKKAFLKTGDKITLGNITLIFDNKQVK
jgi:pSer/pThr/pTyr-binding forkhead associated (FHA) protein